MKKPSVNDLYKLPPIPPGEDEESLRRHAQKLVPEYTKSKKGRGNMQLVTSLMEKTYPIRRADILSGEFDLNTILLRYPYLQCSDQVHNSALSCSIIILVLLALHGHATVASSIWIRCQV